MKIEKISESQIRCTLNKDDLLDRELRISELAYGTDKAKELFRDMMQQASCEFGFEAEDIPLMIEAIPVSPECLILVITKVDDPDELDTRFSKFTSMSENDEEAIDEEQEAYADEIINCFDQLNELLDDQHNDEVLEIDNTFTPLSETLKNNKKKDRADEKEKPSLNQVNLMKVYSFHSLDEIIKLSTHLALTYQGINNVYKSLSDFRYYLVISKSNHTPEEFNKTCNIISEYGKSERATYASCSYYEEHFETIVKDHAIQILSTI